MWMLSQQQLCLIRSPLWLKDLAQVQGWLTFPAALLAMIHSFWWWCCSTVLILPVYDWSHITFLWKLKTSIFDPNDLKSRYNAILPSLLCAIAKPLLLQFSKPLFWHPLWPHVAKVVKPTQMCSLHCWYFVTPRMVQKQRLWKCFTCLTCSALMVHVSAP